MRGSPFRGSFARLALTGFLVVAPEIGWCCPDCAVGVQARAAVFEGEFWRTASAVVAPFVLLGALVPLLHRIDRPRSNGGRSS